MEPDAIIEVRFMTTAEGGRKTPIPQQTLDYYTCPFVIDGEAFDCWVYKTVPFIELGMTYQLPVKFMCWPLVRPKLVEGKEFALLEGKVVATGKVIRVMRGER